MRTCTLRSASFRAGSGIRWNQMARLIDDGPGYHQVADSIAARLGRNVFHNGVLPSAADLAGQYMCSEATVRAAIDELRERGILSTG
jgi:DNA-binding GntR family transcriptional regulator